MKIQRDDVRRISLDGLRPFSGDNDQFFGAPGKEHYTLLAYLSTLFRSQEIIDIGTHGGESALALSYNPANVVTTFDIVDSVPAAKRLRENIRFCLEDLWDPAVRGRWAKRLLESALIFLDIDPHEGGREIEFVRWLEASGYDGLLVLDDIWYFKGMRDRLWSQIHGRHKLDLTPLGHWSGTGLVSFSEPLECDVCPKPTDADNWTLVTGYFDLTKEPDSTPELRARPPSHYLDEHAGGTLAAEQNLVVFTEPRYEEKIWQMRPEWLRSKTRVVTGGMDMFPVTQYRADILKNRNGGPCARDPRNTASYYLFCCARFAMLRRVIRENPFASSHVAWVNICLERMGFRNLASVTPALASNREKFSTCYIDYVEPTSSRDLSAFFGKDGCRSAASSCGGTTFCSGFFTGALKSMGAVCDAVDEQFLRCLAAGYGHADEQLLALVYAESPGLFDWYIGDYQEMVTNYLAVRERPEQPLKNLIAHSRRAGDRAVCDRASTLLLNSHLAGAVELSEAHLAELIDHRRWAHSAGGA